MKKWTTLISAFILSYAVCNAALTDNLLAYYDFEQTGAAGLIDKAPDSVSYNATTAGTWRSGATDATGPGFAGILDYDPGDGLSDRSTLLAGNAINFADADNDFIVVPLGTSELGNEFSISAWCYLAPGGNNTSPRFHAFESSTGWDVTWGNVSGNTGLMRTYVGQLLLTPDVPITHEQWQHVVQVYTTEGADTRLTVYVDGTEEITGTIATSYMGFSALHFGDYRTGTDDRDWDGMIDEVALWDRAVTSNEVSEIYALGQAGSPLVETSGIFVTISSGTGGTTSGSGYYDLGTEVPISATADPGYLFVAWTGDFAGQPASFTYTANAAAISAATFDPDLSDGDGDGLSTFDEATIYGTLPDNPDTDGDGLLDGVEVNDTQTNPMVSDEVTLDFLAANYDSSAVGGMVFATSFDLDSSPGFGALVLSFLGSSDGTTWSPTFLDATIVNGNNLEVIVPAPSNSTDVYELYSSQP